MAANLNTILVNQFEAAICTLGQCITNCPDGEWSNPHPDSLFGESGFGYRKFSRLELYIYLIRRIQHHATQLGLRIQLSTGKELEWVGSGWKDL